MEKVIITNIAMEPIKIVHWQEAVNMMFRGVAFPLESSDVIKTVSSPNLTLDIYRIMYVNYYHTGSAKKVYTLDSVAAKLNVLMRDNYTCAYCLEYGNTVDHIIPKSRGGEFTYGNLITACQKCNAKKKNMTPEEADMKLMFEPTEFSFTHKLNHIYRKEKLEIDKALSVMNH